ncbi:MAG: Rrf2 family transcriptional regulator [Spirochaetales bacterium]|nr:Rrf2 family transcriptional regulator [Spirochaetales bacterium]MBP7264097.1 Rrf2 family transcriptional regulator [Spirochaetia bacterium]
MRMTTKGRYALRATLALARISNGSPVPVSIKAIAEAEDISPEFLEQIFYRLRKAGVIASVRGPGGGFHFSLPLDGISVKLILDAAGEDFDVAPCTDTNAEPCPKASSCQAGLVWKRLHGVIDDYLDGTTLADILSGSPSPAS